MNEQNQDPADLNVERLLSEAYQPEAIDVEFASKTVKYLEKLAAQRRNLPSAWKQVAWLYFANAVAILLLIATPSLFWYYFIEGPKDNGSKPGAKDGQTQPDPPPLLQVGQTASTAAGQSKKFRLADNSIVSLKEKTQVRLDGPRRLTLLEGEIQLEPSDQKSPFVIRTPQREAVGAERGAQSVERRAQKTD